MEGERRYQQQQRLYHRLLRHARLHPPRPGLRTRLAAAASFDEATDREGRGTIVLFGRLLAAACISQGEVGTDCFFYISPLTLRLLFCKFSCSQKNARLSAVNQTCSQVGRNF